MNRPNSDHGFDSNRPNLVEPGQIGPNRYEAPKRAQMEWVDRKCETARKVDLDRIGRPNFDPNFGSTWPKSIWITSHSSRLSPTQAESHYIIHVMNTLCDWATHVHSCAMLELRGYTKQASALSCAHSWWVGAHMMSPWLQIF